MIRENNLDKLFKILNSFSINSELEGELIVLENQFNKLEKERRLGILNVDNENTSYNKITFSLTQIIEKI